MRSLCALIVLTGCSFDASVDTKDGDASIGSADGAELDAELDPTRCSMLGGYQPRTGTDHTYRLVSELVSYDDAQVACAADGAHLVVIDDADEHTYVFAMLTTDSWIGLNDLLTEGAMLWVDGSALSFETFATGEPTNTNNEDCVEMRDEGIGSWNDDGCEATKPAVCECDPSRPAPTVPACAHDDRYDIVLDGRRYRRGSGIDWNSARAECAADGAYLVAISDLTENNLVDSARTAGGIYIGLTDTELEGTFVWVNGLPETFESWGASQPDDFQGQDCVELEAGGIWDDTDCAGQSDREYLCECDPLRP